MRFVAMCLAVLAVSFSPAHAETSEGWSGEGSFSAGVSTGNTETTDFGLGVDVKRGEGPWTVNLVAQADFGETDGEETKNRIFLKTVVDRQLSDHLFGFAQGSYEKDEFSGFENRYFIGGGLGWDIFDNEKSTWTVRGGPGLKVDEVRAVMSGATIVTPAETVESFSVVGSSDYALTINDNVSLTNKSTALYAEESTQLTNSLAVTSSLTNALSLRVSFDVRHDTSPPDGFEKTDTSSRISLVYKFGG